MGYGSKPKDAILLSQVRTLTLYAQKSTSNRRVPAIPQLRCIGGNAQCRYTPDVMRCRNVGTDYGDEDVQWTCEAELPAEYKLGATNVICEGYDSADDPFVLKGSCGVEYRLMLSEIGESRFVGSDSSYGHTKTSYSTILAYICELLLIEYSDAKADHNFMAVVIGVILTMFWNACTRNGARRGNQGGTNGGYGGDNDNGIRRDSLFVYTYANSGIDDHDNPPPYNSQDPFAKSTSTNPWLTGAAGAAAGYAAGRYASGRSGRNQEASEETRYSNGATSSSSDSTHTSTGFGGTSRR